MNSLSFAEVAGKDVLPPAQLSQSLDLSPDKRTYATRGIVVILDKPREVSWILSVKTSSKLRIKGRKGSAGHRMLTPAEPRSLSDGSRGVQHNISISPDQSSVHVCIEIVLQSSAAGLETDVPYSVCLNLMPERLENHMQKLATEIDALQRQRNFLPAGGTAADQLELDLNRKLEVWKQSLSSAWAHKLSQANHSQQRRLTFVTVGRRGSGRSELCLWMTNGQLLRI